MLVYSSPQSWLSNNVGEPLNNISFGNEIDLTDSSWTLLDPGSLIKSVAFSGGFNTVTFNALAFGSQDYNWTSSGDILSPRWYKKVVINKVEPTTDDIINALFYLEADDATRDFDNNIVNGICEDPTSTVLNSLRGTGATVNARTSDSNSALGVWTVNSSATTANGTNKRVQTQSQYGGRHAGSATSTLIDALGYHIQNSSRNASAALTASVNPYYIVGVGTRGIRIIALNNQVRFKAYHKAVKMDLGAIL